jgi:hypothetical protein
MSPASSYFLPLKSLACHYIPFHTTASNTAVDFSALPSIKIYFSKHLTAYIIITTFSNSVEALAVIFTTSSYSPFTGITATACL